MIELRVLGEIRLHAADGTAIDALLKQPKRLALLAYLASPAPGTWHRRDMLLALFWPELDTAHARTALRNGLYVLRQTLGDDVIRNRGDEEISIDPEKLETDLAFVWSALKGMRAEEAIAHYGGELLSGLFPPDSEGFQRWVESERTRLRVALSSASMRRIDELERNGNPLQALSLARTLSDINPNDETIVRRVMSLHGAVGDRSGGLAAFEAYKTRLASDFDADPAAETIEIANRLRSSSGAPLPRRRTPMVDGTPEVREEIYLSPRKSRRATTIVVAAAGGAALLVAMAWTMSRSEKPQTIGKITPITSDEGLQIEAAISPNGRLVAYAKGNANRLRIFVQRIGGGQPWPLSTDTVDLELMPRWSPDNDQILYLARNHAYVAPTLGGQPRMVARGSDGDDVIRSASWSPTGDSLAIVRHDSLFVQPLRGTGTRLVGRGPQLHSCVWSPDSRWIACVSGNWIAFTPGPIFGNDAPSSIVLFPIAGGNGVTITEKDFENESPAWSSDGKWLWMLSNRDGVPGTAYAARIGSDGRPIDGFVKTGIQAEFLSLSNNRIAYSVPSKRANIWAITIPHDTVVNLAAATQLTKGNQVVELVSASRDGRWLMYDTNLSGNYDIYRLSLSDGSSEQVTSDARPEFAAELSPDGREVAWQRWVNNERHLFVKRLDSESDSEILPVKGDQGVPRWSNDGKSLAAWSHDNERGGVFVTRRDAAGKWMKPAWRLDYGQLPQWSPDNREIAFVMLDGSIRSIPADSGAISTIYSPKKGEPFATYIVWKNPETIWMLAISGVTQGIWAVPVATGKPRLLMQLEDPFSKSIGPALTSDGKRFYFALNERFSNIRYAELTPRSR